MAPDTLIQTDDLIETLGDQGISLSPSSTRELLRRTFTAALDVSKDGISLGDGYEVNDFAEEISFLEGKAFTKERR